MNIPQELLNDLSFQVIKPLMNKLAVRNYTLILSHQVPSGDYLATIEYPKYRRVATLTLYDNFFEADEFEMFSTLFHELMHLHFHPLREELNALLKDHLSPLVSRMFDEIYVKREEYIVDDLSVCLSKAVPEDQKEIAYELFRRMKDWYNKELSGVKEQPDITCDSELFKDQSVVQPKEGKQLENHVLLSGMVDSEEEISDNKEVAEEEPEVTNDENAKED